MDRFKENAKLFTRRTLIVAGIKLSLFAGLIGRLFYLQVVKKDTYTMMAEDNRINIKLLAPDRGQIFDRFNVPMATNQQNFQLLLIPERVSDVDATLNALSRIVPVPQEQRKTIIKRIQSQPRFMPVTAATSLSWEQLAEIEVNLPNLPGIVIDEGKRRFYPLNAATAHTVGYVGRVNEKELTGDPILTLPGFQIGKSGIEKQYDKLLQGFPGRTSQEVNAAGRQVRELTRQNPEKGQDIQLTLDVELQIFTQNRLAEERSASAVLMDVHSGAVYTLASSPGFDPNIFTEPIPHDVWKGLMNDEAAPLTHKAISGQYPPGSTFKMVTSLAALEAGISPKFTAYCPGHMDLGNHRFHCWKRGGHGWCGHEKALQQSCDVFFYELSKEVGIENIAKMARRLGLGEVLGIDIPGEKAGLIPNKQWKRGRFSKDWQVGETVIASIGQGYLQATPLQLVTMMARMVNGGYKVSPYLVQSVGGVVKQAPRPESLDLNPDHIELVKRGMDMAVNTPKGTAYTSRILEDRFKMAGKTGTSQVRRITMEERRRGIKMEDLPWKFQHHALFTGYAPLDKPQFAVAVVVEHGGSGSKTAAPIVRDILLEAQKRLL